MPSPSSSLSGVSRIRLAKTAAYYTSPKFGDFHRFFSLLTDDLTLSTDYLRAHPWRATVLRGDIEHLRERIDHPEPRASAFYGDLGHRKAFGELVAEAQSLLGFSELPQLHLVENLDTVTLNPLWDAMSADEGDELRLGIPRGIYFKRNLLTHPYFEFVVAHELVHWAISCLTKEYKPWTTAEEEGICDLIGAYLLLKASFCTDWTLSQLFFYNRSSKMDGDLWATYWAFCKAAAARLVSEKPLVADSPVRLSILNGFDSRTSGRLLATILASDAIRSIPIDSYLILSMVCQHSGVGYFTARDVRELTGMPEENLHAALTILQERGLVSVEAASYYQGFRSVPTTIRYIP